MYRECPLRGVQRPTKPWPRNLRHNNWRPVMTTQNGGVGGELEERDSRYPRAGENCFGSPHL
jgi:hypothetical protein